ncbi:hypothetical protein VTJ49DRAFT_1921 [Mycothermus thermophilus]|uniref:Origin recognition complex subunit 4 n=1 Tax=Humicola insolens TaxID=85995 RepID=A0ABR3VC32_HUMIN
MVRRNGTPAAAATTTTTRKRNRSQHDEEPSATVKKRRLKSSTVPESQEKPNGLRRTGNLKEASAQKETASLSSDDKAPTQPTKKAPANRTTSVYDVPDSDEDELTTAGVTPHPRRSKPAASGNAEVADETQPPKKKRGRPSKKDLEAKAKAKAKAQAQEAEAVSAKGSSTGHDARSRKPVQDKAQEVSRGKKGKVTQRGGQLPRDINGTSEESVRVPRGILTPRKQKVDEIRRPKSVAFEEALDEEEDDSSPGAKTPSKSAAKRRQEEPLETMRLNARNKNQQQASDDGNGNGDEDEDDEVCAICSKPDSEPPNEIVFCDTCDMAVHQECYGIAELPEGDWFCRNCLQEGVALSNGTGAAAKGSVVAREDQRPDIPNFDEHLRAAQRVLLDRCAGRRRIRLHGQDEAYDKAYQLVEQTVAAGEGNSMMVIGPRGCGKTTLVESIIDDLSNKHPDEFHVVRLSGFIHTDDKLALREIWRQLGKEMAVEDDLVNKTTNYADTMASLLALLSHPSEIGEAQDGVTSKSVVFVIDEFDLFATHARQTLLYNLFDIAQARKAPIAVLGLTTRIDVVESLEKRVKSRFSHRYVYLSLPKSLPAYWAVCRQGLSIDAQDMASEGIDESLEGHGAFWEWWNKRVDSLSKTQAFTDHLEAHFCSTKSVSAFLTSCILPLATLSPTAPTLRIPATAGSTVSLEPPDSKLHLLASLSDLDLAMLIAAARLDIVAHTDTVNFAMAYDEYTSLMGRQRVQSSANASVGMLALGGGARVWSRGAAGIAWERLAPPLHPYTTMSKRTVFTTITPLPPGVTRQVVLDFLHDHVEMIDLNPLVKERHPIPTPPHAEPDEVNCKWFSLTDKISYLPGVNGDVTYTCAFNALPTGVQTHCYAPAGLNIRERWTVGGFLPGEPRQPVELGLKVPPTGLYLREDVDMRCNVIMTSFVKKTLKRSHATLVERLKIRAEIAASSGTSGNAYASSSNSSGRNSRSSDSSDVSSMTTPRAELDATIPSQPYHPNPLSYHPVSTFDPPSRASSFSSSVYSVQSNSSGTGSAAWSTAAPTNSGAGTSPSLSAMSQQQHQHQQQHSGPRQPGKGEYASYQPKQPVLVPAPTAANVAPTLPEIITPSRSSSASSVPEPGTPFLRNAQHQWPLRNEAAPPTLPLQWKQTQQQQQQQHQQQQHQQSNWPLTNPRPQTQPVIQPYRPPGITTTAVSNTGFSGTTSSSSSTPWTAVQPYRPPGTHGTIPGTAPQPKPHLSDNTLWQALGGGRAPPSSQTQQARIQNARSFEKNTNTNVHAGTGTAGGVDVNASACAWAGYVFGLSSNSNSNSNSGSGASQQQQQQQQHYRPYQHGRARSEEGTASSPTTIKGHHHPDYPQMSPYYDGYLDGNGVRERSAARNGGNGTSGGVGLGVMPLRVAGVR